MAVVVALVAVALMVIARIEAIHVVYDTVVAAAVALTVLYVVAAQDFLLPTQNLPSNLNT